MPRSMTGFGTAEGPVGGGRLQVEIRTVNHRHFNAQLRLPSAVQGLEAAIRERLRSQIERGHVSVSARWLEDPAAAAGGIQVDVERARAILAAIERLRDALHLADTVDVAFLARQPDVLRFEVPEAPPAVDEQAVMAVVDDAVRGVLTMRDAEGAALARELGNRLTLLDEAVTRIQARAPERVVIERDRLREAVRDLMQGREPEPERLAQEIAYLAERIDLTEELVRLGTHIAAARDMMSGDSAAGRRLGFLAQEMLREINTIGSKANDAPIAREVIGMKEELERLREQLENLE